MATGTTALVTGAPGWLGNRLLHHLVTPHPDWPDGTPAPDFARIRVLVAPGRDAARVREIAPQAEVVVGDLRDPAAAGRLCAGAAGATVFHLAGLIHPARRVCELYELNVDGTRHLLAAAVAAGARRFVATSSNSPAGVSRDPATVFDERSPDRPYMGYGRSKQRMEHLLRAAHREGAIETVILRGCWFYGPEQPERQTRFFTMIREGKVPLVGSGESRRSLTYVDSLALGLLLAAATPQAAGETYWIADARPYTMNEIVDTIEELLEDEFGIAVAHDRMRLPGLASEIALAVDWAVQRAGRYQQEVHVLSEMNKTIACSVEKARAELGYAPRVELREGMRRSIAWCLANGHRI